MAIYKITTKSLSCEEIQSLVDQTEPMYERVRNTSERILLYLFLEKEGDQVKLSTTADKLKYAENKNRNR